MMVASPPPPQAQGRSRAEQWASGVFFLLAMLAALAAASQVYQMVRWDDPVAAPFLVIAAGWYLFVAVLLAVAALLMLRQGFSRATRRWMGGALLAFVLSATPLLSLV